MVAISNYKLKYKTEGVLKKFIFEHPNKIKEQKPEVIPISNKLLIQSIDFGSLKEDIQRSFMQFKFVNIDFDEFISHVIADTIVKCHSYIRSNIDKNETSVSMNDVGRVKVIMSFMCLYYEFRFEYYRGIKFDDYTLDKTRNKINITQAQVLRSIYISFYINYVCRIYNESK